MALVQRIAQGAAATLRLEVTDADGTLAEPSGTVTVTVEKADGTDVHAAGTATVVGSTGVRTVALTSAQTATLDRLTATWTNGTAMWTTYAEIVGGYYFSLATARAFDAGVLGASATVPFTDAQILAARREVEDEFERICGRAFVPRYRRVIVDGTGTDTVVTGVADIRSVRSAKVLESAGGDTAETLSAAELAGLVWDTPGTLRRTDGDVWDEGASLVVLELEYGLDLPSDVATAALVRLRSRLTMPRSDLLDRASSYSPPEGPTVPLTRPDADTTGIDEVDSVLAGYSLRGRKGSPAAPAYRTLRWQSQRRSLFHRR